MTILSAEIQCDETYPPNDQGEVRGLSYDAEVTVRVVNDAAENGEEQEPGPLTWLNSARITTDPGDDAVHCLVSIGDPRGAFCFTVSRHPDTGAIHLHLPYPEEGMAHEKTKQLHPGVLEVVGYDGSAVSYADPEPEEEEEEEDD